MTPAFHTAVPWMLHFYSHFVYSYQRAEKVDIRITVLHDRSNKMYG